MKGMTKDKNNEKKDFNPLNKKTSILWIKKLFMNTNDKNSFELIIIFFISLVIGEQCLVWRVGHRISKNDISVDDIRWQIAIIFIL